MSMRHCQCKVGFRHLFAKQKNAEFRAPQRFKKSDVV